MSDALLQALHPYVPTLDAEGFTLELAFERRAADPLAPGAEATEAFAKFERVMRDPVLAMAVAIDPGFSAHEGVETTEDQHFQASSGRTLYGDAEGGLEWSWGCIDHAADETMDGTWTVLGLRDGRVTCAMRRRSDGRYRFVVAGPPDGVGEAARILGEVLRTYRHR